MLIPDESELVLKRNGGAFWLGRKVTLGEGFYHYLNNDYVACVNNSNNVLPNTPSVVSSWTQTENAAATPPPRPSASPNTLSIN